MRKLKFLWDFEKSIKFSASLSLRLLCFAHAMALIQRVLQSLSLVKAFRCFKHYFWSHKKTFRATWLDSFNMMIEWKNPLKIWKNVKIDKMLGHELGFVFIASFLFYAYYGLDSKCVAKPYSCKAPRCFEHYFWSHRKTFRATWLDSFNMMKEWKIL